MSSFAGARASWCSAARPEITKVKAIAAPGGRRGIAPGSRPVQGMRRLACRRRLVSSRAMDQKPSTPSRKAREAAAAREARLAREAAALRENLKRRKQQARDRQGDETEAENPAPIPDATPER